MEVAATSQPVHKRGCGVYIFDASGRVLLTQRGPKARHEQYKWEGPGGAVEPGESDEDAIRREVREELGVTVSLDKRIAEYEEVIDANDDIWEAVIFAGSITELPVIQEPEKCVGYGWFTREEIGRLSLANYSVKDFELMGWL